MYRKQNMSESEVREWILSPENYFEHVSPEYVEGNCWCFMQRHCYGYAQVTYKKKPKKATHFIMGVVDWEGLQVNHHCDNGHLGCIRPSHMYVGTHNQNMKDKVKRGRSNKGKPINEGEKAFHAKLTDDDVKQIRVIYALGEHTQQELGALFGVGQFNISKIVNNKRWKHV